MNIFLLTAKIIIGSISAAYFIEFLTTPINKKIDFSTIFFTIFFWVIFINIFKL
jgi:hypothetical protein